ncbi:hypothetical protein OAL14_04765 [Gammaproteobacteria bacterium]|nr:hypothetical protein [Gammaproteobacteria bacterium]
MFPTDIKFERFNSFLTPKMIFIGLLSSLFGGLLGLLTIGVLFWLSSRSYASEDYSKHGISEYRSSRLGGLALYFSISCYVFALLTLDDLLHISDKTINTDIFLGYEWLVLAISLIGLADDFGKAIKPLVRLILLLLFAGTGLWFLPEFVPVGLEFLFFSDLFNHALVLWVASSLLLVAFVNAGNIADGANGLLSVTASSLVFLAFHLSHDFIYWVVFVSLIVFSIFNVFTGKVFLGDSGAYAISAFLVLASFDIYNRFDVSIWLFASVLSYPIIELIRVMFHRLVNNKPIMESDNSHLHNFLYQLLLKKWKRDLVANSLTGLLISTAFSVIPVLIALIGLIQVESAYWFPFFLAQTFVLIALADYLKKL